MEPSAHLDHLRRDAAALLAAYRADPSAAVPSCPGWSRTDLLAHVAGVHAWVRGQLAAGTEERVRFSDAERPPDGDELPGWFEAGAADLVAALGAMDLAATWPTWAGPQPGTFFPRRMAHETALHRRDAVPSPIDADLAVDGVDEHLEVFAPRIPGEKLGRSGTIHLHATDDVDGGEWLIRLTDAGIAFDHGHAKGDVAVRGQAGDLLLWVWNRAPVDDRFEVFGDAALLDTWRQAVVF
jgi:uncharacterized protein (TIGR03083 family)